MNTVYDAKLLGLPKIEDPRGNMSIIEQIKQIPFEIKRVSCCKTEYKVVKN